MSENPSETRKWYFVMRQPRSDDEQNESWFVEIQILNEDGQSKDVISIDPENIGNEKQSFDVPHKVILAALKQKMGQGDYVDENGDTLPPF